MFSPGESRAVNYEQGDWVSYTDFKYISSIAADQKVVYFGTTGGIIRYDRFADTWLDPLTASGGLPSNNVQQLAYDPQYNDYWARALVTGDWDLPPGVNDPEQGPGRGR